MHQCSLSTIQYILVMTALIAADVSFASNDSTDVSGSTGLPNKILIRTSGYINTPPLNSIQQSFTVPARCPSGFTPYVVMEVANVLFVNIANTPQAYMTGFGICVNGLSFTATTTTVGYLVVQRYMLVDFTPNSGLFLTNNFVAALTTSNSTPMPATAIATAVSASHFQALRGINWRMYCYPPNLSPPIDQRKTSGPSINDPDSPISNGCVGGGSSPPF